MVTRLKFDKLSICQKRWTQINHLVGVPASWQTLYVEGTRWPSYRHLEFLYGMGCTICGLINLRKYIVRLWSKIWWHYPTQEQKVLKLKLNKKIVREIFNFQLFNMTWYKYCILCNLSMNLSTYQYEIIYTKTYKSNNPFYIFLHVYINY